MRRARGGGPARRGSAAIWVAAGLWALGGGVSAEIDGVYRLNEGADCGAVGREGGSIRVQDRVLYAVGSQCRMLNPVRVRNMDADLVDMMCSDGTVEWTERAIVMRGAKKELILVWNGYAFAYPRCPNTAPVVTDAVRPHRRPEAEQVRPKRRPIVQAQSD